MVVESLLNIIPASASIRIMHDKEQLYAGYLSILTMQSTQNTDNTERIELYESIRYKEVKSLRVTPEIRHKEWKTKGLMPPIEPDKLPQYSFSDLRMDLYYAIYI